MLATANRHKRREFALILPPHEVLPMPRGVVLPPESTESFAANARAKARALLDAVRGHAADWAADRDSPAERDLPTDSGSPTDRDSPTDSGSSGDRDSTEDREKAPDFFIADDSGLEVEALGWGPGVISSRYSGREGDDAANIDKLLVALAPVVEETARRARFVCELACLAADGREVAVRGEWWGRIARSPRGDGGFGYDPVFVPEGSDLTVAELSDEAKNRASHRARAARALLARLREEGLL
jgi:XTP/dITP diphosphohydrolase